MIERSIYHSGPLPPLLAYGMGLALAIVLVWLLSGEIRRHRKGWRGLLFLTRLGMLAVLTLLLAQPNLVETRYTQEQGHSLLLVDDSASMFVRDDDSAARDMLHLAALAELPSVAELDRSPLQRAERLDKLRDTLGRAAAASHAAADAVRMGLPWSDASVATIQGSTAELQSAATFLTDLSDDDDLSPALREQAAAAAAMLRGASNEGATVQPAALGIADGEPTQAQWLVLSRQYQILDTHLEELHAGLLARQDAADTAFLADAAHREAVTTELASLTRYDLARRVLADLSADKQQAVMALVQGEAELTAADAIGHTDVVTPLAQLLAERPLELLDAVILVTDGGQNLDVDLALLRSYERRRVPLILAGIGGSDDAESLRLLSQRVPGIIAKDRPTRLRWVLQADAPAGTPITVRLDLARKLSAEEKAADAEETTESSSATSSARDRLRRFQRGASKVSASDDGESDDSIDSFPHTQTITVDANGRARLDASVKIDATGFNAVTVSAAMAGGTLDTTAPIYVADDRPRILLIAERPNRFVTSVLAQRRHDTQVYPLYSYGRADRLTRGSRRGDLPEKAEDWDQYDLLVLSGAPYPGWSDADAQAIAQRVLSGKLAVLVAGDAGTAYTRALAPLLGIAGAAGAADALPATDGLTLATGANHLPAVRLRDDVIQNVNAWRSLGAPERLHAVPAQDQPLLLHPTTDSPVLSLGFYGYGKVAISGMDGMEAMLAWEAVEYDGAISRLLTDLLTPMRREGDWAVYPAQGTVGRRLWIRHGTDDPNAAGSAALQAPAKQLTVALQPQRPGLTAETAWLAGQATPTETGEFVLDPSGAAISIAVDAPRSSEQHDTRLNAAFLREVAAASGGRYVALADLPAALAELTPRSRTHVDSRTWRLLDFGGPLLLIFLILAVADFSLRKLLGLVL